MASAAWGTTLRTLLGDATRKVAVLAEDSATGRADLDAVSGSITRAGLSVVSPRRAVVPVAGTVDAADARVRDLDGQRERRATRCRRPPHGLSERDRDRVRARPRPATSERWSTASSTTRGAPAVAEGTTVFLETAPFEAPTAAAASARRRRARAADAQVSLSLGVAVGYWSADLFVRALRTVGRALTVTCLVRVLNEGSFSVRGRATVGRTTWPLADTQGTGCGALVQSAGTRYVSVVPWSCPKLVRLPT